MSDVVQDFILQYWLYLICYLLISSSFTDWLANKKGYNPVLWFFIGLLFGPIAFFAIGFAPDKNFKNKEEINKIYSVLLEIAILVKKESKINVKSEDDQIRQALEEIRKKNL